MVRLGAGKRSGNRVRCSERKRFPGSWRILPLISTFVLCVWVQV